jgi:hypothetical protein
MGKLRINSNRLEISNDGSNWYQVFPCVGQVIEVVADDTNSADNFKVAYLSVGQTILLRNKNRVRAAAVNPSLWQGCYYHTYAGDSWLGIFPSGLTISNGRGSLLAQTAGTVGAGNDSGKTFVPIVQQANQPNNWTSFNLILVNGYLSTNSINPEEEPGIIICCGQGSFPSNGYFLGVICYEGTVINVDYFAVRRLA